MNHHPDIQAALQALAEGGTSQRRAAVERIAAALAVLLRASYQTKNPTAWSFSPLTGDGFPLELAFTTADSVHSAENRNPTDQAFQESPIRYTVDPGGPDLPVQERLQQAMARLEELEALPAHTAVLDHLMDWQRQAPIGSLDYGAWVGGRHAVAEFRGASPDRYKLYIEIPPGDPVTCQKLIAAHLNPLPRLPERELELRMIALEPVNGRMEYYFRAHNLLVGLLGHLLYPAGLRSRRDELLEFLQQAYGYPLDERIPGGSVGFSYAISPGEPVVFTLFLFTRLIWGGDLHIRRQFCERLSSARLDARPYWQVTERLASRNVYQTYHGLLGIILAGQAPIQLSLGVRPPPLLTLS